MTKILIIENDAQIIFSLEKSLSGKNYKIIEAKNGAVGIEKVQKHMPDIILCDVNLPKTNGYQVLKALKSNPATIVIPLILIGSNRAKAVRKGMNLGADDYLFKPLIADQLSEAIAAQLKKQSLIKKWFPSQFQHLSQQKSVKHDELASNSYSCPQIKEVFDFIEAHYHEAISLRDVAKELGFSPTYLTELVKRETGKTVNRWIIKRRLTAACTLLLETTNSIESIAESVGYNNLTHFFNQFRKHYSNTPNVWRKTNRNKWNYE